MSERSCGESLGWFIAGLLIGGILGIVYAPYSGEETRSKIISTSKKTKEELLKKVEDLKKSINESLKREEDLLLEEEIE